MPQTIKKPASGNGRSAIREERRQQLINATIDSISRKGFSGTTLETVTKGARLSHGVVNFHFDSKEDLYLATLEFLADEHHKYWHGAMLRAGSDPVLQLTAIIEADFNKSICSAKKLAVWFAFWGQAKYRPNYLKLHNHYDDERAAELLRVCDEIIRDGGYQHLDAVSVTRSIEALVDGLWLNLLLYPKEITREDTRDDCFRYFAQMFPKHFAMPDERSAAGSDLC
ncbi:MAG: TetR family transcriptional regulator C-terminal domain-containing protein [Alphaproteobacteria bacterium]|jgi:TetR/AcrR family transcriptional regulator, transcriptional repressor of bet genes|nr:TetR family transcriptional regulator [Rhodospirillaceae bacterium]MBT7613599.1 TetR family transcriptional regulator [Rhodospirillaceae bacterium]MDG2481998.1 TetR family transcriptional regulator C-terminal domain-containing protein [Alphaproteobacteria bacterium]